VNDKHDKHHDKHPVPHDARVSGSPLAKSHLFHVDAAKNPDGTFNLAELKKGAAYWMGQYRDKHYSIKRFTQHSVTAEIDALIIVRHKGHGPHIYDLDRIEQGVAGWFGQLESGTHTIVNAEEIAVDEDDDVLIMYRKKN